MKADSDTMTQVERLDRVFARIPSEKPDRLPIFLMDIPEYSDCYQEFLSRREDLVREHLKGGQYQVETPCGDYSINVFLGTDIVVKGNYLDLPNEKWIDEKGLSIEVKGKGS